MITTFGPPQSELMPGAKNAVETCLAVKPHEAVALIADETSRAVAAAIESALEEREARCLPLLLEDFGPRPMKAAPALVLDALESADVGIMAMTPQPGELGARMSIVKVVERRQIRYAHMIGVTPQIMQQGMRADYKMVDRLSDKLRERMLNAQTLSVRTEAGTVIDAHFDRGLCEKVAVRVAREGYDGEIGKMGHITIIARPLRGGNSGYSILLRARALQTYRPQWQIFYPDPAARRGP